MEGEYLQLLDTWFRITVRTDRPALIFCSLTTCRLNGEGHLMQHTSMCIRHFLQKKAVSGNTQTCQLLSKDALNGGNERKAVFQRKIEETLIFGFSTQLA